MGKNTGPEEKKKNDECAGCNAKCCRYFALQIDTPRTKEDFEEIRWYLAHKRVTVFVEKRKWFLQVFNECGFLTENHGCAIYEERPLICREHPADDCEYISEEFGHDFVFKSMRELDEYKERRFRKKKPS